MPTVTSLPGISITESSRLRSAGYADVERLWEAVEREGFEATSARASLSAARLAELLGAFEITEVRRTRTPWRDHPSGLLVQLLWVVMVALAIASGYYVVVQPMSHIVWDRQVRTYAIVAPPAGLPAYRVVSDDQITKRAGPMTDSDVAAPDSIAGRYTLQPLAAGAILRTSQISVRPLPQDALKGRKVVSLSTAADGMPQVIRAGKTYGNVHTTTSPGGEIRGQIHDDEGKR